MNKTLLIGLIILALTVVVLLFQRGSSMNLNLIFDSYNFSTAFTLFSFTIVGVAVGLLLK